MPPLVPFLDAALASRLATTLSIFLVLAIFLPGCSDGDEDGDKEVLRVQLGWLHQSQWAGFYAAEKKGFYREEHFSVELLPRLSPSTDTIGLVMDGKADFGTMNGIGLINARAKGKPVLAISAIYQRDAAVFMTLAEKGITNPQDFPGRSIRKLNPVANGVSFRAMMHRLGLNPDSVREIDAGYDMTPFFEGKIDIWPCFLTDEVLRARRLGYEVNVILPEYYGIHRYGMVIFGTEKLIELTHKLNLNAKNYGGKTEIGSVEKRIGRPFR
ncbi:MAG: hypothetical protein CMN78_05610, partial [Spirochaetales bacterium]|nr:hypothetical protein [Spirochaetales bacterium]